MTVPILLLQDIEVMIGSEHCYMIMYNNAYSIVCSYIDDNTHASRTYNMLNNIKNIVSHRIHIKMKLFMNSQLMMIMWMNYIMMMWVVLLRS